MLKIIKANFPDSLEIVRDLFKEYASSLNFDLDFQNFKNEITNLPGEYSEPNGTILLAKYDDEYAGCVALRKIHNIYCEMKRLYVMPYYRGKGIGRELCVVVISIAKDVGYSFMRLDSISEMRNAISLYKSLGFYEIEPYRYNPIKGAIFMELRL
jgi:ribosomal protein S18 acetylase RimI-like enzyme